MSIISIKTLINSLKAIRLDKKLTQDNLALKLGIPQSHLSKIESAKVNPTLGIVIEIARVLDLELMLIPTKHTAAVSNIINKTQVD
jgi:transcriptional regulator with XRE-family HTH domain